MVYIYQKVNLSKMSPKIANIDQIILSPLVQFFQKNY